MDQSRFTEAMADVSKFFASPRAVVAASGLETSQKIVLLKQWEADMRLLLVAAEENMPGEGQSASAERLREVRRALATLGAAEAGEDSGAAVGTGSPKADSG